MSDLLDRIRGALIGLRMPRALEALDHTLSRLELRVPRDGGHGFHGMMGAYSS